MAYPDYLKSNVGVIRSQGAAQYPAKPVAGNREVCTNTNAAVIATIAAKTTKPAQSSDLTAANCCYVIERDPVYNLILTPLVGHASNPTDLWFEGYVFGVEECAEAGNIFYRRTVLAYIKGQGNAAVLTPSSSLYVPGLGNSPTLAKWAMCDVIGGTTYLPDPGLMEIGELAGSNGAFAVDAWGYPYIEIYPVCALPSGESGSAASGVTFWYRDA